MRDKLIEAFVSHARGHIDKHVANVEVLLHNPVGIGEHGDIINEIEKELTSMMRLYGRPGLYDDWVRFQAEARKKRREEETARKLQKAKNM